MKESNYFIKKMLFGDLEFRNLSEYMLNSIAFCQKHRFFKGKTISIYLIDIKRFHSVLKHLVLKMISVFLNSTLPWI